jgi:hypothetical protein
MAAAPSPTGAPAPGAAGELRKPTYVLRVNASKSEADLATSFLTKGGTLGAAAARGPTNFAISQAETHDSYLLTEVGKTIDLPLPDALLRSSEALFQAETGGAVQTLDRVGPHVLISDRARLNVLSMRSGAAINGTLVSTLSGTASVPLASLFGTQEPEAAVEGATGKAARPVVPFAQVPLQYPNWNDINATLGLCYPQIVRANEDGSETEVSAIFFTPSATTKRLAQAQPLLKSIYDKAWKMTELAKFAPEPNLTKSVGFVRDKGIDASGYTLAASANNTPPAMRPEATEAILRAALAQEMQGDHAKVLDALRTPSITATAHHTVNIATALSSIAAWAKPYRVDGAAFNTPQGLKMMQSESWPFDASLLDAGDCDDGAGLANQIIEQCKALNASAGADMDRFPNMRVVANSIGAHYVHGMTVLAANAGHAEAADTTATKVAGHAIITLTPKDTFAIALQRGSRAKLDGKFVVEPQYESAVTAARWEQLYPKELVARMPEAERPLVETYEAARKFATHNVATKLQPYAIEPTTFASATLYKHDDQERADRQQTFVAAKKSLGAVSPNMLRMFSALDVGETGEHAFYSQFVEKSMSMNDGLFTSGPLRSMGAACCHVRHVRVSPCNDVIGAGTTPKELATGDFALVPLWTVDTAEGALLDEAHAESLTNAMPMRGEPAVFDDAIFKTNMETLHRIKGFLQEEGKAEMDGGVVHQGVVSFASLVGNANALKDFERTLRTNPNLTGEVFGLDEVVGGVAVSASGEEMGRYVVLELELPA